MSKHTPGPWMVFNHSWSDTTIFAHGFDHGICSLDINHATEESQEADEAQMAANARLIAAAPDLLLALKNVMTWVNNWSPDFTYDADWPADRDRAEAAIAKAEAAK